MKTLRNIVLICLLLFIASMVAMIYGYRRGYDHGEKLTNKWWIDQQSQYYDASEVLKKRRDLNLDTM
jgi:membrane protein DedA with SNARE-associated domain